MGFIPISFTVPVTAQTIRSGDSSAVGAVVAGVAGATAEGTGRLAAVTGGAVPQKSPMAGAAANVAALRAQLEALLQAGGRFVCVHPYVHPVGDRRGEYSYLTPSDCVAALAGKVADPEDGAGDADAGNLAAVCVLLHGADHGPFAALLTAFNAVFPVTELQLAERRARQLVTLEKDKRIIATAPKEPRWVASAPHRHGALCGMDSALGALVAQSEAFAAENASAEAELAALMQARVVHVAQLDAAWQALCSGLTGDAGDAGLGWYLSGDAASMARQLAAGGTPVSAYKLCAALCWVFGYPRTGALVVVEFAYGRPDHPLIRNVYPLGLSLPQLQAGELRWMQSEAAHQGIDADGNWTRKTDMAITDASRDRIITAVRKMETVAREIRRVTENSTERVDGVKRVEALGALRLLTAGSARLSAGDSLSLTTARDTAITTGQDALQVVGRNVRTDVRGAVTTTVAKAVTETIGAGRTVTVTADDATTVGGNATESVAGDKAVTATNINLQCRNTLRLGAGEVSLLPLMVDVWEQVRQALEVLADHTHQSGAIPKPDQSGEVHGHAGAVGADRDRLEGVSG